MKPWSDDEIATLNSPSSSKCSSNVFSDRCVFEMRPIVNPSACSARSTSGTSSYSVKWWQADQAA